MRKKRITKVMTAFNTEEYMTKYSNIPEFLKEIELPDKLEFILKQELLAKIKQYDGIPNKDGKRNIFIEKYYRNLFNPFSAAFIVL